jgi:hypothetical protein
VSSAALDVAPALGVLGELTQRVGHIRNSRAIRMAAG